MNIKASFRSLLLIVLAGGDARGIMRLNDTQKIASYRRLRP